MKLSQQIKDNITSEYNEWYECFYGDRTLKQRQEMGQFFTPPEITIQMIEQCKDLKGTVLDPTCGSGCLLAGAILAGADPKLVYGIELDKQILGICKKRLSKLGVPDENIHHGNALNDDCYDNFNKDYYYDQDTDTVFVKGRKLFKFGA